MQYLGAFNRLDDKSKRLWALGLSLVVIWLAFHLATGGLFLTPRNFYNLAVQSSTVAVLTVGMVMVIVSRNIDLSVGSILGLTGMLIALLQVEVFPADAAWNWPLTILIGLAVGTAIGLWHGFLVAYIGIPSFVVTLAGLLIFRGATFEVAQGKTISPFQDVYRIFGGGADGSLGETASWIFAALCMAGAALVALRNRNNRQAVLGAARAAFAAVVFVWMFNAYDRPQTELGHGIPSPILILALIGGLAMFVMGRTPFGLHVFAVGKDIEAARLVGVPTRRVVLKVFAVMGALCAVGAIITTSRLNAGTTNLGTLLELNVIAAAVIGGASLDGRRGSILGGILGAFVIQSLDTGLVLLGVTSSQRQILIGFVLIGAVLFDRIAARQR
jgi:D-xylose transport system permease protein